MPLLCERANVDKVAKMLEDCMRTCPLSELEFELRLGRSMTMRGGRGFNAHVDEDTFHHVQRVLDGSKAWSRVAATHTTDYFPRQSGVRVQYDHEDGLYTCMTKEKMRMVDIECPRASTDIRCAVARERVLSCGGHEPTFDWLFSRDKTRTRYAYRHFAFDLTKVRRQASRHYDSDEEEVYEIEVELTDARVLRTLPIAYVVEHALLLCSDVLAIALRGGKDEAKTERSV